jgi:lysyl-tRNA synthetase class 2
MNREPDGADWRPGASRHALEARARLLSDIRQFFADRNVLEVETPILSRAGNSDPNLRSLSTDSEHKQYLRTSPEYAMKRLLAAGLRDIYEVGRVFRAGESGRFHNPEFTLLEWYRLDMAYLDLAAEVAELIRHCAKAPFNGWPLEFHSYRDLFRSHTGLDPWFCTEEDLAACAAERGLHAAPLEQSEWLDLIFAGIIQPALAGECISVVHDYLPEQAALARIRNDDPPVAERFEVYLGQVELANGYQELTDAAEQGRRFERELRLRAARGEETAPVDRHLLAALDHGLPPCAGVALGVDRLLMGLLKLERISAVLAFSDSRA